MTKEIINAQIDTLVSLKAQIAALEEQKKMLEKNIKGFMTNEALSKMVTPAGHKALLSSYVAMRFNKDAFIAENGQDEYDKYTQGTYAERFSVA